MYMESLLAPYTIIDRVLRNPLAGLRPRGSNVVFPLLFCILEPGEGRQTHPIRPTGSNDLMAYVHNFGCRVVLPFWIFCL